MSVSAHVRAQCLGNTTVFMGKRWSYCSRRTGSSCFRGPRSPLCQWSEQTGWTLGSSELASRIGLQEQLDHLRTAVDQALRWGSPVGDLREVPRREVRSKRQPRPWLLGRGTKGAHYLPTALPSSRHRLLVQSNHLCEHALIRVEGGWWGRSETCLF